MVRGKKGSGKCTGSGKRGGGGTENNYNIAQYYTIERSKDVATDKNGTGTRNKLYEKGNVMDPCLAPPPS